MCLSVCLLESVSHLAEGDGLAVAMTVIAWQREKEERDAGGERLEGRAEPRLERRQVDNVIYNTQSRPSVDNQRAYISILHPSLLTALNQIQSTVITRICG